MLTFSLFRFLYSGSFSFPTAALTLMCDGDQLLVFDWWQMVLQFILWKSISLYILVYFNHLLLQVAICPVANPLDENDSEEQQHGYPISSSHIGTEWIDRLIRGPGWLGRGSQRWIEMIQALIERCHVYFSDRHITECCEYGVRVREPCLKWQRVGVLSAVPVNWQTVSCLCALKRLWAKPARRKDEPQ